MKRILNKIVRGISPIGDVKAIILYGSLARGDYTSRSDIDLLILTSRKASHTEVQDAVIIVENEIGRSIQPTIRALDELKGTDTGLLQNIFQEGKAIYLSGALEIPSALLLQQKPYVIYTFRLGGLDQKEKARFNRTLYEYTKGKRKYGGLLQKMGGMRLSSGCVMVPYTNKAGIEKALRGFRIKFESLKVWK